MNNECFDSHPGGLGKIPGVGTIIIHFLGEIAKTKNAVFACNSKIHESKSHQGRRLASLKIPFWSDKAKLAWLDQVAQAR